MGAVSVLCQIVMDRITTVKFDLGLYFSRHKLYVMSF